jgi:hypothetical protein
MAAGQAANDVGRFGMNERRGSWVDDFNERRKEEIDDCTIDGSHHSIPTMHTYE